ncbi:MAG: helix-hairpin-helix domain-containing protein [Burkholderiales bacterium]|nr:helix-hairpin-helix domain-containing protein [Burkholderiales bacterium]
MAFTPDERRVLCNMPGIGPGVVDRLEQAGVESLEMLRRIGADAATARVCRLLGSSAWGNRRRALERALTSARADVAFVASSNTGRN